MMTNLAQMVFWKSLRRKGTRLNRHGPTVLVLIAVPLAMLDLTRHVLQDGGVWTDSHMYRPGCPHADARCLNALGAACFLSTYLGFAALIAGVLWSADLFTKVRDGWRRARVAAAQRARARRRDAKRAFFYDDDARPSATFLRRRAPRKGSGNGARGASMRGRGPRDGTRATFVPRV